jgi:hypothetical protein
LLSFCELLLELSQPLLVVFTAHSTVSIRLAKPLDLSLDLCGA